MSKFTCGDIFDVSKEENYISKNVCDAPWTFFIEQGGFKMPPYLYCDDGCGFETKEKAEEYRQEFLKTQPFSNHKAVVSKVISFVDGKAEFELDKEFSSAKEAHDYLISKCEEGSNELQGEPEIFFNLNDAGNLFCSISYIGYEIKIVVF